MNRFSHELHLLSLPDVIGIPEQTDTSAGSGCLCISSNFQIPISIMSDIQCVMHSTCAGRQTGNHFYLFFHYFFLHCLIMAMTYRAFVKSEFCSSRQAVLRSMTFHLFEILVVSMGFPHFHFWFSKS